MRSEGGTEASDAAAACSPLPLSLSRTASESAAFESAASESADAELSASESAASESAAAESAGSESAAAESAGSESAASESAGFDWAASELVRLQVGPFPTRHTSESARRLRLSRVLSHKN